MTQKYKFCFIFWFNLNKPDSFSQALFAKKLLFFRHRFAILIAHHNQKGESNEKSFGSLVGSVYRSLCRGG